MYLLLVAAMFECLALVLDGWGVQLPLRERDVVESLEAGLLNLTIVGAAALAVRA